MQPKIILGSGSQRRKELLSQLRIDFEIVPSKYEEDMTMPYPPVQLAKTLAAGKAREVANRVKGAVVIGADTFCTVDGKLMGKPKSREDAKQMMRNFSGKAITVITGLCLINTVTGKEVQEHDITKIHVKELTEQEIEEYIATGEGDDKAGAMCMQGLAGALIPGIEGSYSNALGLPVYKVAENLKKLGVKVFGR